MELVEKIFTIIGISVTFGVASVGIGNLMLAVLDKIDDYKLERLAYKKWRAEHDGERP